MTRGHAPRGTPAEISGELTLGPNGHVACTISEQMLPAYIIEELRRREEARKEHDSRPTLELPLPLRRTVPTKDDAPLERGVVIIELMR